MPAHELPTPGSWIKVGGKGRFHVTAIYRGRALIADGRHYSVLGVDGFEWRLCTEEELYCTGTGTQMRHQDFTSLVETVDNYRGYLAHYVWVGEYCAHQRLMDVRRNVIANMRNVGLGVMEFLCCSRPKVTHHALVDTGVLGAAAGIASGAETLCDAERDHRVWRERSERIDRNVVSEYKTTGFPNLTQIDEAIDTLEAEHR